MRRQTMRSLQSEDPVLSLPELIDALQEAGVELGTHKVRGNDYSRAVAAKKLVEIRAKVDAALLAQAAAPLLAEMGARLPEQADACAGQV